MPANYSMTWEPKPRRWRKMHKGKLYTISCEALGVPENKEASYRAANAWWLKKQAELEHEPQVPHRPHHDLLEDLEIRRDVARNLLAEPEAQAIDRQISLVSGLGEAPTSEVAQALYDQAVLTEIFHNKSTQARVKLAKDHGFIIPDDIDPSVLDYLLGDRRVRLDREARKFLERIPQGDLDVPQDRTVTAQVSRYLALERVRVEGGELSVGELEIVTRALHDFVEWIGAGIGIEAIDADRLESWWSHLFSTDLAVETKKKKFRHIRSFIRWMAEKGLIESPLNLLSRRHRFGSGLRAVPTLPKSEVKELIDSASGQLRLHLLLMCNCGMTQIDISDLKPSEVDWDRGRIKRKRSKTDNHPDVPTVDYPLWASTFDLLKRYGRREGNRALLTVSGLPWVRDKLLADGRRSKVDNIKSNFAHLKKRMRLAYSMKILRKTSASLLASRPELGEQATMFLGHAPDTMARRHYTAPDQENFDRAIVWLGEQYGFHD